MDDISVLRPPRLPTVDANKADHRWTIGKFTFRADFDSGNLMLVRQGASPSEFQLWTRNDCQGTSYEKGTRTWFYFGVSNFKPGDFVVLTIMNLNKQGRLYSSDYRPWVWSTDATEWLPLGTKVSYRKEGDDFQLRFSYKAEVAAEVFFAFAIPFSYLDLQALLARTDKLYGHAAPAPSCRNSNTDRNHHQAAHAQSLTDISSQAPSAIANHTSVLSTPWNSTAAAAATAATAGAGEAHELPCARPAGFMEPGGTDQLRQASGLSAESSGRSATSASSAGGDGSSDACSRIYYRRQLLTRSLERRRIELITISDWYGVTDAVEPQLDGIFPQDGSGSPPAHVFREKKVFFVSSRVHPGETPATHMFNGLLALLLRRDDARAAALRRLFVFKLVPFVNPDGVYHGNYRTDTIGQNLNRYYIGEPDLDLQPSVFAIKQYLLQCAREGVLEYYIDLHAHANKKGVFAYGNALAGEQHIQSLMYSKLVALNNPIYDFMGCNFTEKNMSRSDKDGTSKEGAGRVALFRDTGLTHLYTIEANYNTARELNLVAGASGEHGGRASPPSGRRPAVKFTAAVLQGVGRAFAIAALDMASANPWSRLPNTEYRSASGVRSWVLSVLRSSPDVRQAHLPAMSDSTWESCKTLLPPPPSGPATARGGLGSAGFRRPNPSAPRAGVSLAFGRSASLQATPSVGSAAAIPKGRTTVVTSAAAAAASPSALQHNHHHQAPTMLPRVAALAPSSVRLHRKALTPARDAGRRASAEGAATAGDAATGSRDGPPLLSRRSAPSARTSRSGVAGAPGNSSSNGTGVPIPRGRTLDRSPSDAARAKESVMAASAAIAATADVTIPLCAAGISSSRLATVVAANGSNIGSSDDDGSDTDGTPAGGSGRDGGAWASPIHSSSATTSVASSPNFVPGLVSRVVSGRLSSDALHHVRGNGGEDSSDVGGPSPPSSPGLRTYRMGLDSNGSATRLHSGSRGGHSAVGDGGGGGGSSSNVVLVEVEHVSRLPQLARPPRPLSGDRS